MTVDISNAELARRLDETIRDFREDMGELGRRMETAASQFLNREVYEARHQALLLRMERMEVEQRRMVDEERQREQKRIDEQRNNRRLLISAVVMPTVLTVITIIMNFQGPT